MRILTPAITGCLLALTSIAQAKTPLREMPEGAYTLDKTHASLVWKVSHLGLSDYTARFANFDAELVLDPKNPDQSSIEVTIDPTSIRTDYPYPDRVDFDKKLANEERWFNAPNFPEIQFSSTNIEIVGENKGVITGNLIFMGETRPVKMDATFNGAILDQTFDKIPTLGFSATSTIKRSDFGMGPETDAIGDTVRILIEVEFKKQQ